MRVVIRSHQKFLAREEHMEGILGALFGPLERWTWVSNVDNAYLFEVDAWRCFSDNGQVKRLLRRFAPCAVSLAVDVVVGAEYHV